MDGPPDLGGFTDVDAAASPAAYAGYLDDVRGLGAVARWKERSFALLDPRPGARLLDVGCGTGDDVLALARLCGPDGSALGVDASAAMVAEARRRAAAAGVAGARFATGDAQALDLPDAAVDGCRAERTLLHLAEPARAVAEMARVVRPAGRVVLVEPDWHTLVVDAGDAATGHAVAAAAAERFRQGRVGRALRRLLLDAGLADVEVAARALVATGDAARADRLFDLAAAARAAAEEGRVTAEAAAAWLAEVRRAGDAGRLLVAMTSFMAAGRRP
ncbi:methyltransferase domain-containing protein [Miltoncostaea marina]|uniref:methyltransferase domain-containing protein n=1 Tax=Miltoncostaea marina TaxID=2843215 RepID=UPI001C3C53B4|nr:methyltransferase domain-containing protein [Miltoncostaea marina]